MQICAFQSENIVVVQPVVRFATYLASIQGFTIEDTLCSDLEVRRVGVDDYGRLPA